MRLRFSSAAKWRTRRLRQVVAVKMSCALPHRLRVQLRRRALIGRAVEDRAAESSPHVASTAHHHYTNRCCTPPNGGAPCTSARHVYVSVPSPVTPAPAPPALTLRHVPVHSQNYTSRGSCRLARYSRRLLEFSAEKETYLGGAELRHRQAGTALSFLSPLSQPPGGLEPGSCLPDALYVKAA